MITTRNAKQSRPQRPNGSKSWIQQSQARKPLLGKPAKLAENSGAVYIEISAHKTAENTSQLQIATQIKA
jgi:hypothetical protein